MGSSVSLSFTSKCSCDFFNKRKAKKANNKIKRMYFIYNIIIKKNRMSIKNYEVQPNYYWRNSFSECRKRTISKILIHLPKSEGEVLCVS